MNSSTATAEVVDLNALRGSFASQFAEWDKSVRLKDVRAAKRIRRNIKQLASSKLVAGSAANAGYYIFLGSPDLMSHVRYIGIAKTSKRPLGGRLVDRLRDDSCLDTSLDKLTDDEFRRIVRARLLAALPRTGANYVENHLRTAHLFRASRQALLISSNESAELICQVEKALIGGAAAAGAQLFNRQHVKFQGRVGHRVARLSCDVIDACAANGLALSAANNWKASCLQLA